MRYDRPDIQDELAQRYALGSMRGAARRRLERLMLTRPALTDKIRYWEATLNLLVEAVPAVEPPAGLWLSIERAIDATRPAEGRREIVQLPVRRGRAGIALWRGLGLVATGVAAALAIYIGVTKSGTGGEGEAIAILSDEAGHAAFVATSGRDPRRIKLIRITDSAPGAGRAYELWLLPKGGTPRPIGVLPETRLAALTLTPGDAQALAGADGVAISVEPSGGSPTGLPTGPIPFIGKIILR